jgi:FMN reductase
VSEGEISQKPATALLRSRKPFIVGIGGTARCNSSSERALRLAVGIAEVSGAETLLLPVHELCLPVFDPERSEPTPQAERLIEALKRADGIIISSPSYHGCVSGMVKNVLDYAEDLRSDGRVYLEGRAVGCITTAAGWQATGSTLQALRSIVHALRGWPTPLGVAINTTETIFEPDGGCPSTRVHEQLETLARQVVGFARAQLAVIGAETLDSNERFVECRNES